MLREASMVHGAHAPRWARRATAALVHQRRCIGDLIRAESTMVNDKRVHRLYRLADLAARKRRGRKRLKLERVPLDFVSECLAKAGGSSA